MSITISSVTVVTMTSVCPLSCRYLFNCTAAAMQCGQVLAFTFNTAPAWTQVRQTVVGL